MQWYQVEYVHRWTFIQSYCVSWINVILISWTKSGVSNSNKEEGNNIKNANIILKNENVDDFKKILKFRIIWLLI